MKIELKLCSLIQIAATPTWLLLLSVGCRTGALNESKVRDESSIEEITVQGRSYISSCGNYTATNADYEVKLKIKLRSRRSVVLFSLSRLYLLYVLLIHGAF